MKNIGKIIVTILLLSVGALSAPAQNLIVRSMKPDASDLTACTNERLDLNNRPCALVKVQIPLQGMQFEGSIIQPVEYKAGEYWVYMPSNTKMIKIKHPSFKPLFVRFTDYDGVGALQAKVTYVLDIDNPAAVGTVPVPNEEVTFRLTPAEAILVVDDEEYEVVDGIAKISLPHGSHKCSISYPGYKVISDEFVVKKGMPKRIYELESKTVSIPAVSATAAQTPTPAPVPAPVGKPFETFTVNGVTFEMVRIDGGSFMMGSSDPEIAFIDELKPVSKSVTTFYIGGTEVTQDLWDAVMEMNTSYFHGGDLPVETVSYEECQTFCDRLSQLTGRQFRLPTNVEWEYAARGGNRSLGYKYSGSNDMSNVGWYKNNSEGKTHPVGTKQANELGIYDMSGNVSEWTSDLYVEYGQSYCDYRGGNWDNQARGYCHVAYRTGVNSDCAGKWVGFRLAL